MKDKIKQQIIDKYILRIKIDYPEDDKLMMDLLQFESEIAALEQESKENFKPITWMEHSINEQCKIRNKESKEQKIKDKCSKIYDKVKEAITPDKRTFEQAEKESKEKPTMQDVANFTVRQLRKTGHLRLDGTVSSPAFESKEQPPDGNYDVHVKMNTKKTMKGKLVMDKDQSAEEMVEENFKGLDSLIDDEDLLRFYKDLIVTCLHEYAQKRRRDELIKYEIAQNTTGGKLHGSKERIIECIDNYLNPKP